MTGSARAIAASPFLNVGTTALYRGTLSDASRADRDDAIGRAVAALQIAVQIDPASVSTRRNLSLALAAGGDRDGALRLADEALALTAPDDRDALFGVGRAYAAAGALDVAIATWTEIGAGPQLLRLGRQLSLGPDWETGISALVAAARVGAPVRPAADAITRSALAHGESTDAAIKRLEPLLAAGGMIEYFARLQVARLYRLDGRLEPAETALTEAYAIERDEQFELERGLQLVWREHYPDAEQALLWVLNHPADPPKPVPDGDDPTYWLALVRLRLGRSDEAVTTARAGLAALPSEQASLRVEYHLLLGESLLAAGKPDQALTILRAGQRLAPADVRFADVVARARAARR
jgi:tetratricopeptide (TPR) repeat protein